MKAGFLCISRIFIPFYSGGGFNGLDYMKETDTTDCKDTAGYTRIRRIKRIPFVGIFQRA